MVLKLYGYPLSTATHLVALICKEKQIPYEFIFVDLHKGEHKLPGFLQIQPFAQVPYIDDDGFILYESRAIARYLIKKYPDQGPCLIPTDLKGEALFEQASSIEISHFDAHTSPLVTELFIKPRYGGETDQAKVDKDLKALGAKLDVYEIILSKQKYLAGDNLTLADLQHLPFGTALPYVGVPNVFEKRPNVTRWWNDIYSRPAWQAVKTWAWRDFKL